LRRLCFRRRGWGIRRSRGQSSSLGLRRGVGGGETQRDAAAARGRQSGGRRCATQRAAGGCSARVPRQARRGRERHAPPRATTGSSSSDARCLSAGCAERGLKGALDPQRLTRALHPSGTAAAPPGAAHSALTRPRSARAVYRLPRHVARPNHSPLLSACFAALVPLRKWKQGCMWTSCRSRVARACCSAGASCAAQL